MSNTTSTVRRAVGTLAAAAVLAGAGASSASAATTHQRHGDCAPSSRSAQQGATRQATAVRQDTSTRTLSMRTASTTRTATPAASTTWRSRTDGARRTASRGGAASARTTTSTAAARTSIATSTAARTTSATVASTSISTAGLSTNAVAVLRAVNATFPQITDIGGLRSGSDAQDHATGHALDLMTSDKATGDQVAAYLQAHAQELGVHYVIWRQHIWNVQRAGEGWRLMADRGSVTANHYDHVHVSVN